MTWALSERAAAGSGCWAISRRAVIAFSRVGVLQFEARGRVVVRLDGVAGPWAHSSNFGHLATLFLLPEVGTNADGTRILPAF